MTRTQCSKVRDYVGGKLSRAERELFHAHLRQCAGCQGEFESLVRAAVIAEAERGLWTRIWKLVSHVGGDSQGSLSFSLRSAVVLAASLAALFVLLSSPIRNVATGTERTNEVRFSRVEADGFRPLKTKFGVSSRSGEAGSDRAFIANVTLRLRGDRAGIATVHLLRNNPEDAVEILESLDQTAENENDRGAAALLLHNPDEALEHLDRALQMRPSFAQAHWNKGLALRDLRASLAAAAAFREAGALGAPEWREEAESRAKQLEETVSELRDGWDKAEAAGRKMLADGTPPPEELLRDHPGILRHYFYHAIRGALSPDVPNKLLSTARILDENTGGTALTDYVERVARADFGVREPLARKYRLVKDNAQHPVKEELLAEARRTGQTDILFGTLAFSTPTAAHPAELVKLAAEAHDPWLTALAEYQVARSFAAGGRLVEAQQRASTALTECRKNKVEYRCAYLGVAVAEILNSLYDPANAHKQELANLDHAIRVGEWQFTTWAFENLATSSSMLGAPATARAYLAEVEKRRPPKKCSVARFLAVQRAELLRTERRFTDASRALLAIPDCEDGSPVQMSAAETWGDLARVGAADTERALSILEANRKTRPGDSLLALADAVEGRLVMDRDRDRAVRLLHEAIRRVDGMRQPDDQAREARAVAFATLIDQAARDARFTDAMALFVKEAGEAPPPDCAVGVSQDTGGIAIAVRGPDGTAHGERQRITSESANKRDVIPRPLLARVEKCAVVDVFARTPFLGRADLLPPQMAWRYRLAPRREAQPGAPDVRVFVSNVAAPENLDLPPVIAPPLPLNRAGLVPLTGKHATPSAVLTNAERATVLEIYAHGVVDPGVSEAAHIVLAHDGERSALTASDLATKHLRGAPLVLLASCRAATLSPSRLTSFSLPAAFIRAGARAVLASPADVPSDTVAPFFETIRQRVLGGTPPAIALRDARMVPNTDPGLRSIVLFE